MSMPEISLPAILDLLSSIPGVRAAVALSEELRRRVVELEDRHEQRSVLPIRNLGMRLLAASDAAFALLKDGAFRPPGVPTVYLVEEGVPAGSAHVLTVAGERYAVVGEEVMDGRLPAPEATIPLGRSFVIFPQRRADSRVPCLFILPPVGFPELEREGSRLGIRDVFSISPSLAADGLLRESLGFPPSNDLATLLIGCARS